MAVSLATSTPGSDYPALFRGYVARSVQHLLRRIRQAEAVVPAVDQEHALNTLGFALKLPEVWVEARELLLTLAPKLEQAGYRDEWMPFLKQGLAQSQALTDLETAAELQLQLGVLYQLRGNYAEARAYLTASAHSYGQLKAADRQARALNRLAQVARLERNFEDAVRLVEQAFALLGVQESERAFGYLVLGTVALDRRDWTEAADYFQQSFQLWMQAQDRRMMGRSLMSLGAALRPQKKYEEAMAAYQQAINLFEATGDPIYRAVVQMNLGNIYLSRQEPQAALALYQAAERVFRQAQDRLHLAHVYHNTGLAYRQSGQWAQAQAAYRLSLEQQHIVGNIAWLVDTLDGLGLVYLATEQFEAARATFQSALDRLANIEGEPGYQHLVKMVNSHLQQVKEAEVRESRASPCE